MEPGAPSSASEAKLKADDWLLAVLLCLIPLLGAATSGGDALTLLGVGVLLWTAHRAPLSPPLRRVSQAAGITAVLVLTSLMLLQLHPGPEVGLGEAGLASVFLLAFLRRRRVSGSPRRVELVSFLVVVAAAALLVFRSGPAPDGAAMLGHVVFSLALVYGIHGILLRSTDALPVLTRAALFGVGGLFLVNLVG